MQAFSSERVSDKYLLLNSCGMQDIYGYDAGSLRVNGRRDYHLLYIAEGMCFVRINGETHKAPKGSVIIYPPGQRQEYFFKKEHPSKSYYMHFTGSACSEILTDLGLTNPIYYTAGSLGIVNLYDTLIAEFYVKDDYSEYTCHSILLQLLTTIARVVKENVPEKTAARTQIQEICKHIYASARQNKSIADYAKICNLSESRFSHLFHEITGTSPKQYILNAKIEIAKELLKNTELSVAQVGEQIGFSDQNYFSRIFKKNVFLSPSAYRLVQKKD